MMKTTTSRLISIAVRAARTFCTSATEEIKLQPNKPRSLYGILSPLKATGGSVEKTLNQYLREGNTVKKREVEICVKELRRFKRFQHALELIEWMEKRGINLSHSDHAVRIDLIQKVKGIYAAEEYFNKLPSPVKNKQTYGALLNCYCMERMTEKALTLFDKMIELNFASTTLAYNSLLSLYTRIGEPKKVPLLVQEMKEKEISLSTCTYNILMNSYSSLDDINGVETVMEEMHIKDNAKCDWTTYSNLAAVYAKAGLSEKAELALQALEKKLKPRGSRLAYHFLISLYGVTSNLTEVRRVWHALKAAYPKTNNLSYLCMLQALAKLDDLDGLVKCFEEWESGCIYYDMNLTNVIVLAYLRRGMFKEAKLLCEGAVKRGFGPTAKTHEIFMNFFLQNGNAGLAMKCLESAIFEGKDSNWKLKQEKVSSFFKLFEEEKDVAGAEKFSQMLKKFNCLDSKAYCWLLTTYVAAGQREPKMRQRMKADEIEIGPEIEELLEKVCS